MGILVTELQHVDILFSHIASEITQALGILEFVIGIHPKPIIGFNALTNSLTSFREVVCPLTIKDVTAFNRCTIFELFVRFSMANSNHDLIEVLTIVGEDRFNSVN